jgi:dolichol-phosphate mannosyltransferase
VIIPTYNERENLRQLTQRLAALPIALDILFIDDGSPDGTGQLAEELAQRFPQVSVIHRQGKLGYASAVIEGFRLALKGDYSWILQMDADLSHDPAAIPLMVQAAEGSDLVLGSRYVGGVRVIDWEISRVFLSWFANLYARTVTGIPVHDVTTGFRCYRRSILEAMDFRHIRSNGYGFLIELGYRIWRAGGRLTEVPIIYYGRQQGVSKMSRRIMLEAAILVWRLRLRGGRPGASAGGRSLGGKLPR